MQHRLRINWGVSCHARWHGYECNLIVHTCQAYSGEITAELSIESVTSAVSFISQQTEYKGRYARPVLYVRSGPCVRVVRSYVPVLTAALHLYTCTNRIMSIRKRRPTTNLYSRSFRPWALVFCHQPQHFPQFDHWCNPRRISFYATVLTVLLYENRRSIAAWEISRWQALFITNLYSEVEFR